MILFYWWQNIFSWLPINMQKVCLIHVRIIHICNAMKGLPSFLLKSCKINFEIRNNKELKVCSRLIGLKQSIYKTNLTQQEANDWFLKLNNLEVIQLEDIHYQQDADTSINPFYSLVWERYRSINVVKASSFTQYKNTKNAR